MGHILHSPIALIPPPPTILEKIPDLWKPQVPQFVLEEAELQGSGAEVHIVVTQPRRIAAIR